ncbi:MAG: helix-turn-helix transcriptional regulator [Hamadaea sp.]|nr:helix-turn-helix transcriptional regulator [Hamadaea sp.]
MTELLDGGGPHAWPLMAGSGYVLGRFDCPPDADRWRSVDWIGAEAHVVLPHTPVRIGAVGEELGVCTANEVVRYDGDTRYRRSQVAGSADRCTYLAVGDELAHELRLHRPRSRPRVVRLHCPPAIFVLHRLIRRELGRMQPDVLGIDEAALRLLADTAGSGRPCPAGEPPAGKALRLAVEDVKAIVAADPARVWLLAELAGSVHYSPFFLSRAFRRLTGQSIARYRRELCLRMSLPEAIEPGADLARTAHAYGFSSHSHYTHAFRKAFGCTPSQMRATGTAGRMPAGQVPST